MSPNACTREVVKRGGRGRRVPAIRLVVVGSLVSLTLVPLSAGATLARFGIQLRPLGATSVAQGMPFSFQAIVRNPTPNQTQVTVTFRLISIEGGGTVDGTAWHATVPGGGSTAASFSPVSSQWFADQGAFEVHALIHGQDAAAPLAFVVTPPTVAVPTFQDVTAQAGLHTTIGPSMCGAYAAGAAWADVDGDGDLDLYVPRGTDPAQLWINDGTGHFTEEAAARGVQDLGVSGLGAVFADYDNDGDQDLYVANDGPNRLYQNDGTGHFTDVAATAGVLSTTDDVSASWGDYDDDGYLDLYVVSNSPCLPPLFYEQDHLYHNEGDGTFTDQTALLPAASTFGAGYQAAWVDYDGDGDQDLYLANDWWGPTPDANHLWRNDGKGLDGTWKFTDVSKESGTDLFINSMGIAVGDFNRDLHPDLAISNIAGNVLARNNGDGSFTDVASTARVERASQTADLPSITWGLAFADLNLDGWEDLFVAAGDLDDQSTQPNEMFTAAGDGTFLDLSALSGADDKGSGRGVAIADYDRDGRLDVYVVNRLGSPILFHNTTFTSGHWLEVDLTGTRSNRDGCGARVLLSAGGSRQLREAFCGSVGLSSGSDTVVHVGLGASDRVDRLVIDWPSGRVQVLRNVAADQLVSVVEPA